MPTYVFRNTETEEEWEQLMKIAEMEEFLEKNPHIKQVPGFSGIGDAIRMGKQKPDEGFRDILREMKHKVDDRGIASSHTDWHKRRQRSDINTF
jgi:hypothetical protein